MSTEQSFTREQMIEADEPAFWEVSGEEFIYLPGGRALYRERKLDDYEEACRPQGWLILNAGCDLPPDGWRKPIPEA